MVVFMISIHISTIHMVYYLIQINFFSTLIHFKQEISNDLQNDISNTFQLLNNGWRTVIDLWTMRKLSPFGYLTRMGFNDSFFKGFYNDSFSVLCTTCGAVLFRIHYVEAGLDLVGGFNFYRLRRVKSIITHKNTRWQEVTCWIKNKKLNSIFNS